MQRWFGLMFRVVAILLLMLLLVPPQPAAAGADLVPSKTAEVDAFCNDENVLVVRVTGVIDIENHGVITAEQVEITDIIQYRTPPGSGEWQNLVSDNLVTLADSLTISGKVGEEPGFYSIDYSITLSGTPPANAEFRNLVVVDYIDPSHANDPTPELYDRQVTATAPFDMPELPICGNPRPTPTPTPTSTVAPTLTPTPTSTPPGGSPTLTPTATATPTTGPSATPPATSTIGPSATPTVTSTPVVGATQTPTVTPRPSQTATRTPTRAPTRTPTKRPATKTPTPVVEPTATNTPAPTATATPLPTSTPTPAPALADPRNQLGVGKAADRGEAAIGDTVVFTMSVSNIGTLPVDNVTLEDMVPSAFRIDATQASLGTVEVVGQRVTLRIPRLLPGERASLTITTTVVEGVTGPITNVVTGSGSIGGQQISETAPLTLGLVAPRSLPRLPRTGEGEMAGGLLSLLTLASGLTITVLARTRRRR